MDDFIGKILDKKYKVIKYLGGGGFGNVYLAEDKLAQRKVAIKVLKNIEEDARKDLIEEIQCIASLSNSSIVSFYHHFVENDLLFMVMEYCEKGSLRDRLLQIERFKIEDAFEIAYKLAEIFEIIHNKGIVHHDIKPDNILFSSDENIKISDFGVANKNIGTVVYLPPEMFLNEHLSEKDFRVDIYSLGVTILELITGQNPFRNTKREEQLEKRYKREIVPNKFPHWVQEILFKALNPTPERRFQNMKELKEAIKSKNVPNIQNDKMINAHIYANKAEKLLKQKKWRASNKYIEYSLNLSPNCIPALILKGKFYLSIRKIKEAEKIFERVNELNPRTNIQKELGWINLELGNYSYAISLLNDYLYRCASDFEAHNLLLKCFYESNRFEISSNMGSDLLPLSDRYNCLMNNIFISDLLNDYDNLEDYTENKDYNNPFIHYNKNVISDDSKSWDVDNYLSLKNKLLFQEYGFDTCRKTKFENVIKIEYKGLIHSFSESIISIGRNNENTFVISKSSVSRRHCVIVNMKNEIWLYDLNSTLGTFIDEVRVSKRIFLTGVKEIKIASEKILVYCREDILI